MEIKSTIDQKTYPSKSAMIKKLIFTDKLTVGEVSKKESILYQHVRNVKVNYENDELLREFKKQQEGNNKK